MNTTKNDQKKTITINLYEIEDKGILETAIYNSRDIARDCGLNRVADVLEDFLYQVQNQE